MTAKTPRVRSLAVNQPKTPKTTSRGARNGDEDAATRARREATAERAREAHLKSGRRARGVNDEEMAALRQRAAAAEAEVAALRAAASERSASDRADEDEDAGAALPRLLATFLADATAAGAPDPQAAAAEVFVTCVDADWRAALRQALEGPARLLRGAGSVPGLLRRLGRSMICLHTQIRRSFTLTRMIRSRLRFWHTTFARFRF